MVAQAPEDAIQIMFLSISGKITSINRTIDQGFPDRYLPHIQAILAKSSEGDLWADEKRMYAIQSKPDKEKLKRNVQQVITYLDANINIKLHFSRLHSMYQRDRQKPVIHTRL
nr:PREDICTED: uncharacterized protein LOC109030751 [Bemisia tabaci]